MDLSTTYLGLNLRTPLVSSAGPIAEDLDMVKRLEDAGASAVVLPSLFEEELTHERLELHHHLTFGTESYAESLTFFPEPDEFYLGPEGYLEHIRKCKAAVDIPIIASLNGSSLGGWVDFARKIQEAGADALELNIYVIPTELEVPSENIEQMYVAILKEVRAAVKIPIAMKLSPFFTNMAAMAKRLVDEGADGLVLFNRFYQPDIDLKDLEVKPNIILSSPMAMRLPLTWIGILYGRVDADFAANGGIHFAKDAIKMLMVGAKVTMMLSALLKYGVEHIKTVENGIRVWMEEQEYESVRLMQGSMSMLYSDNPGAFERTQYRKALHSYRPHWKWPMPSGD